MRFIRFIGTLAVASTAILAACEDTTTPAPPPPLPQINATIHYTKAINKNGMQTGLQHNNVFSILVTSTNETWIGNAAGVAIYTGTSTTLRSKAFDQNSGMTNPGVRAMVEHNGEIYVGTWGGGISRFDMTAGTWTGIRKSATGLTDDHVSDIFIHNDLLYFATNAGVSILDPATSSWTRVVKKTSVTPSGILLDPVVSAICVATRNGKVERWYGPRYEPLLELIEPSEVPKHGITVVRDPGIVITYTLVNSALPELVTNDIIYDAATDLFWVALATKGIAAVDVSAATWTSYTTANGLPSNTVYSLAVVDGALWAATQGGVARMRANGSWQGYDRNGGLPVDRVRLAYFDDSSRLWLGYIDAGAGRVDPISAQ